MKTVAAALVTFFAFYACDVGGRPEASNGSVQPAATATPAIAAEGGEKPPELLATPERVAGEPRNVMEFFERLPEKYFTLEGCYRDTDKNCRKARADYLKTYTEVSDIPNGYFKGGCDGGQSCIEMAIFKRPNGSYLIGVYTMAEIFNDFYFLDYAGGQWRDASSEVPGFSPKYWYALPRVGTTMAVHEKKVIEKGDDYEATEKGRKLYDLVWKDGKFTKK